MVAGTVESCTIFLSLVTSLQIRSCVIKSFSLASDRELRILSHFLLTSQRKRSRFLFPASRTDECAACSVTVECFIAGKEAASNKTVLKSVSSVITKFWCSSFFFSTFCLGWTLHRILQKNIKKSEGEDSEWEGEIYYFDRMICGIRK